MGNLSKVVLVLLAPLLARLYPVVFTQFVKRQHCVEGSLRLYFGAVKSHNCSLYVANHDNIFVFRFSEYKVGCCSSHYKNVSFKDSRIVAKMNGFFVNVVMTVVDKTHLLQSCCDLCGS